MSTTKKQRWYHDPDLYGEGLRFSVILALGALAIAALAGALLLIIPPIERHSDRVECAKYERATGIDTKYVRYGWWSGECFVNRNGTWVEKDQLTEVSGKLDR